MQVNKISYPFVIATTLVSAMLFLPQSYIFLRNDMMGILLTVYYMLFVAKYVNIGTVFQKISPVIPYLLLSWLVAYGMSFKYGFVLPGMTLWSLLMPAFASIAVIKRNNKQEQKMILLGMFIIVAYVSYNTLMAVIDNPNVMRANEGGGEDSAQHYLRLMGIGNYGYAYSMGALFVALFSVRKIITNKYKRLFMIASVFCAIVVLLSQYATLLFICIFSVFTYMILNAKKTDQKILLFLLAIIIYFSLQGFIYAGITIFEGQVLGEKFQMIYDGFWGTGDIEHLSADRSEKQLNAFRVFLQSPIIGNNYFDSTNQEAIGLAHSTIISILALTGLIGLISYLATFFNVIKYQVSKIFADSTKTAYFTVLAFYAFFAVLNPIDYTFETSWVIFFIVPIIFNYFVVSKS